jgi:FkbM family methyltransferase
MNDQMRSMVFRPYSQCGEDRIIELLFTKLSISQWTWLDIGAGDPLILSNTALFYEQGCRGINVEPNKALYRKLCERRPEDINLNVGVGPKPGYLEYYMFEENSYLNTCIREEALSLVNKFGYQITDTRRIPVMTINQILEQYCQSQFPDILDLDMEGMDLEILRQIDFSSSSPKIIVLETVQFGSVRKNPAAKGFLEKKATLRPMKPQSTHCLCAGTVGKKCCDILSVSVGLP